MRYSTTRVYETKRGILNYSSKISAETEKDQQKFVADMIYGILASKRCILSQMADVLMEDIRKKNTVDRLSRKLTEEIPDALNENYLQQVRGMIDPNAAMYVDNSDVTKPYGKKFEAMGKVRDGSDPDHKLENGYSVTEIVGLTRWSRQPVSVYTRIHSSHEEDYISENAVTFEALECAFAVAPNATYVFDRGYDMNDLFTFMYEHDKQFIIRLTEKRNLFWKGKWFKAPTLRDSHKGKFKTTVMFGGVSTDCYVSCLNVQITESRRKLSLILVYGLGETPMMLVTNRVIKGKADVIRVVRTYFSRWRIEEYFRFKKDHFGFEDFRVRTLVAMNALNRFVSYAIGFLCMLSSKPDTSIWKAYVLKQANAQREKVSFLMYRFGLGVFRILGHAYTGIRDWFHIGRQKVKQLEFRLAFAA